MLYPEEHIKNVTSKWAAGQINMLQVTLIAGITECKAKNAEYVRQTIANFLVDRNLAKQPVTVTDLENLLSLLKAI